MDHASGCSAGDLVVKSVSTVSHLAIHDRARSPSSPKVSARWYCFTLLNGPFRGPSVSQTDSFSLWRAYFDGGRFRQRRSKVATVSVAGPQSLENRAWNVVNTSSAVNAECDRAVHAVRDSGRLGATSMWSPCSPEKLVLCRGCRTPPPSVVVHRRRPAASVVRRGRLERWTCRLTRCNRFVQLVDRLVGTMP